MKKKRTKIKGKWTPRCQKIFDAIMDGDPNHPAVRMDREITAWLREGLPASEVMQRVQQAYERERLNLEALGL